MNKRVCAAAVFAAFSAGAFAQSALDQARTAAGMAAIDRAQSTGFLAGLERAMKTPLEIVWLRASTEDSLWNDPALSRTSAVGRTAWRYVFGGNAQFAPRPNEVARLVVSTLNFPQGPINAGRLDLTGTGRLYLVTPQAPGATPPERLAMILAAGSTLHISDATSPSIHIELKAPETRPLLLGNLAASDIGKVLSLLVKPGGANAFEASVGDDGKVALRSGGEVQLAALLPNADVNDLRLAAVQQPRGPIDQALIASLSPVIPSRASAPAQASHPVSLPQIARDFATIAGALEAPVKDSGFEPMVVASLAPSAEVAAGPRSGGAPTRRVASDLHFDMGQVASVMQSRPSIASAEQTIVASLVPAGMPLVSALPSSKAPAHVQPTVEFPVDSSMLAAAAQRPSNAERTLVASLAPAMASPQAKLPENAQSARSEAKMDFAAELSVVASAAAPSLAKVAPTQIAALAATTGALEFRASSGARSTVAETASTASPDLARMRAEIEAEIARERERLAAQFKPQVIGAPAPKRFVLGV